MQNYLEFAVFPSLILETKLANTDEHIDVAVEKAQSAETYAVHFQEVAPALPGWRCYPRQSIESYACLWLVAWSIWSKWSHSPDYKERQDHWVKEMHQATA